MQQPKNVRSVSVRALVAGAILALAGVAAAVPPLDGNLFITEEQPGNVHQFDGLTGAPLGIYSNIPAPRALMAIHTGGAVGDVLVGSATGGAWRLDRNTGAPLVNFNPSGGWQWAAVWRPSASTVLIGDMSTDDIREYDATTGAYLGTFATGISNPADMVYGPNGNLFVCSFDTGAGVYEINASTGAIVNQWGLGMGFTNDILFMPDGRRIVTAMGDNMCHVFDSSWNPITTFAGTGWARVHGIDLSPHDGRIYVVDGFTTNVHAFDPNTYAELDFSFASTPFKPVDIEFRPAIPAPGAAGLVAIGALAAMRRRRTA